MAELEASASSTAEAHGMSRMQELLSSYYGMQDRESEQETLRNIDAKGFDAGTYVKVREWEASVVPPQPTCAFHPHHSTSPPTR